MQRVTPRWALVAVIAAVCCVSEVFRAAVLIGAAGTASLFALVYFGGCISHNRWDWWNEL